MPSKLVESEILVLLSKQRRRILLGVLHESNTPLALDELANRVAEREFARPTEIDRQNAHISLYHTHLPRLGAADVVEYDESDGMVEPGANFDCLIRVFETVTERDRPWSDD